MTTATAPPWWAALADAVVSVPCGGDQHTVRWSAGALHLDDHGPTERELTLVALGGAPSTCAMVATDWLAHVDDLDLLVLAPRHPAEVLVTGVSEAIGYALGGQATAALRAEAQRVLVLRRILDLPPDLLHRLVLTVAARSLERFRGPPPPVLHAAVHGRLRPIAARWTGRRHRPRLTALTVGAPPWARVADDGVVEAGLGVEWLVAVWGRGLGVVDDRLVLSVEGVDPVRGTAAARDGTVAPFTVPPPGPA